MNLWECQRTMMVSTKDCVREENRLEHFVRLD
jgi:hypothetical protein